MSAQHTPGPWHAKSAVTIVSQRQHVSLNGARHDYEGNVARVEPVTSEHGGNRARLANAYLIAAAPDLLIALEDAIALIRGDVSGVSQSVGILSAGEAAIAKALGQ